MHEKNLSIIIPVYNAEAYLCRCIESFIHQIDEKAEVILVDDGSVDESGSICDQYEKKYSCIKTIHQKNKGEGSARNTGIKYSTGKWLFFVDADDILANNFYEECLNNWNGDEEVIIFDYYIIGDKVADNEISKQYFYSSERDQLIKQCFLGETDSIKNTKAVWGKLFRRSFLEEHSVWFDDENVRIGEDMIFMLAVYTYFSKIKYVSTKIYGYYYGNEQSITNQYKPEYAEMVNSYITAIKNWLMEYPEYEIYHMTYRLNDIIIQMKFSIFHEKNRTTDYEKRKQLKQFIAEGQYKKYYIETKRSGLIKSYNIKKRITFFLAIHNLYMLLKIVYKIRYQKTI